MGSEEREIESIAVGLGDKQRASGFSTRPLFALQEIGGPQCKSRRCKVEAIQLVQEV